MEEHYKMKDDVASLTAQCLLLEGKVRDRDQLVRQLKETIETNEQLLQEKSKELSDMNVKYNELG